MCLSKMQQCSPKSVNEIAIIIIILLLQLTANGSTLKTNKQKKPHEFREESRAGIKLRLLYFLLIQLCRIPARNLILAAVGVFSRQMQSNAFTL